MVNLSDAAFDKLSSRTSFFVRHTDYPPAAKPRQLAVRSMKLVSDRLDLRSKLRTDQSIRNFPEGGTSVEME